MQPSAARESIDIDGTRLRQGHPPRHPPRATRHKGRPGRRGGARVGVDGGVLSPCSSRSQPTWRTDRSRRSGSRHPRARDARPRCGLARVRAAASSDASPGDVVCAARRLRPHPDRPGEGLGDAGGGASRRCSRADALPGPALLLASHLRLISSPTAANRPTDKVVGSPSPWNACPASTAPPGASTSLPHRPEGHAPLLRSAQDTAVTPQDTAVTWPLRPLHAHGSTGRDRDRGRHAARGGAGAALEPPTCNARTQHHQGRAIWPLSSLGFALWPLIITQYTFKRARTDLWPRNETPTVRV